MMRAAVAMGALLLTAPASAADPEIAVYNRCVAEQAVRLSTGSDAADLIARNAAVLCGQSIANMMKNTPAISPALATAFENRAIGEATIAVLEARAKRK